MDAANPLGYLILEAFLADLAILTTGVVVGVLIAKHLK